MSAAGSFLGALLAAGLWAAAPAPPPAPEVPVYKAPVLVRAMGFAARYKSGKVLTSWKRYKRADFRSYKLVRSSTMHDPVFPENGEIFSTSQATVTAFEDGAVDPGVWYYRLCIITKTGERWVSPVVEVKAVSETVLGNMPKDKDFE